MGCVYAKQSPAAASAQMQMQMHRHLHFHRCGSSNNNGNGVSATCASRSSSTKHSGRFQAEILEAATTQAQDDENGNGNGNGGVQDENEKDIVIVARSRRYANACVLNPVKCNTQAEQLAAGWPSWLTTVACEAIRGWIPRKADSFEKLDKIGQGTYSNVYKARDLESGKIVALKKVRFDNLEPESVRFMAREIQVLRRLDHPNVVKLEGLVTSRMSCSLYLVFEYMDHDLAGLGAHPGIKFTESQVKCFMQQLLCGLDHCHVNGVLHRDIKGSNLLIDNDGILKIADFGLATFFSPGQKQPLTSRVVTLWYRPPELLLGATEYGVGVDLWSAGCLLSELLNGKPILPGRTEVEQLHKIFKLCGSPSDEYWKKTKLPHATIFKPQQPYRRCISETFKDFPPSALSLIEKLLSIEAFGRGTAASALKSEFFLTKPFACAPSCLPKYPPSKELDVKIRDDEARRNRITVKRGLLDVAKRAHRESKAVPAPDGNAELITSIQKRRLESQSNLKSQSEMFSSQEDDGAVGFPIDPPRALDAGKGPCASNTQMPMTKGNIENDRLSDNIQRDSVSVFPNKTHSSFVKENPTLEKANGSQPALGSLSDCSITSKAGPSCWDLSNDDKKHSNHVDKYEDLSSSSQKCAEKKGNMEIFSGHDNQDDRVEFSGPLLSQSANIDKLLERHERQIQQAVRRVRHDKSRIPKNALSHTRRKLSEYRNWISRGHGSTTYDLCTRPNVGEVKGKA